MKKLSQYIKENKLFEEETNKYLIDVNYINENLYEENIDEGLMDWFKKFFSKTRNFLNKWFKRGGSGITVNLSKGKLKIPKSNITTSLDKIKEDFGQKPFNDMFKKTLSYINNHKKLKPESIKNSNVWNNKINESILYYIPNNNFEGEDYPIAVMLYSTKVEIEQKCLHIFNFEMYNKVKGITEKDCFKYMLDNNNIKEYSGLTYSIEKGNTNLMNKQLVYGMYNNWISLENKNACLLKFEK